jgi:hypothetical protein
VVENFLSPEAASFLDEIDSQIFEDWDSRFPSEKSLAGVVSRTIFPELEQMQLLLDTSGGRPPLHKAFHHRSYASGLFVDIFREFNNQGVNNCVIATQSAEFKEKFLYDNATMTGNSLVADFNDFVDSLRLTSSPTLNLLVFEDLEFDVDILQQGKKQFLKLNRR